MQLKDLWNKGSVDVEVPVLNESSKTSKLSCKCSAQSPRIECLLRRIVTLETSIRYIYVLLGVILLAFFAFTFSPLNPRCNCDHSKQISDNIPLSNTNTRTLITTAQMDRTDAHIRSRDTREATVENVDELLRKRIKRDDSGQTSNNSSSPKTIFEILLETQVYVMKKYCMNATQICMPGEKGDQGIKGDSGQKGNKGDAGPIGVIGHKGNQGDVGTVGERGAMGLQGLVGINGSNGEIGDKGDIGKKGESGEKGLRGEKGNEGINGTMGDLGTKGDPGKNGTKGEIGLIGKKGDQGIKGDVGNGTIGPQGHRGEKGVSGEKGERGYVGVQGPQGNKGDRGDAGMDGKKGDNGSVGQIGAKGEAGVKGQKGSQIKFCCDKTFYEPFVEECCRFSSGRCKVIKANQSCF